MKTSDDDASFYFIFYYNWFFYTNEKFFSAGAFLSFLFQTRLLKLFFFFFFFLFFPFFFGWRLVQVGISLGVEKWIFNGADGPGEILTKTAKIDGRCWRSAKAEAEAEGEQRKSRGWSASKGGSGGNLKREGTVDPFAVPHLRKKRLGEEGCCQAPQTG
jgi:hypothetical protein